MKSSLIFAVAYCISLCSSVSAWNGEQKSLVQFILKDCQYTRVSCVLKANRSLVDWLKENNRYTVLEAGKTGTGKTRLIKGFSNNITSVGKEVVSRSQTLYQP